MKKAKTKKTKMNWFFAIVLTVLVLYTALMFGLFLLGINISLKQVGDIQVDSNIFGLPNMKWWKFDLDYPNNIFGNYLFAMNNVKINKQNGYYVGLFTKEMISKPIKGNMLICSFYTILYAGGCALFGTFMPMYMGYLCSMYNNKVSKIIYAIVLFVIATPIVGAMPATIDLMRSLRLYDTFFGEFLRRATFTNMYFLIFFAYFQGLSKGFSEAAEIDGASQISVMFRIYLPLAMNIFFTVFLILFVSFWNDFTTPMMYLPSRPTLAYLIYYSTTVNSGANMNEAPKRLATLMVFAIPIIIVFVIFNKKLMTNLTMGGVKE